MDDLLSLEKGVEMYDAHLQQMVLVKAPVLAFMGDNPRVAGHLTGYPNKFCRQCMVILIVVMLWLFPNPATFLVLGGQKHSTSNWCQSYQGRNEAAL